MAGNLTREEARQRAERLNVSSYEVELDLTQGDETFESVTTARFSVVPEARSWTTSGPETFIELHDAKIRGAVLNGTPIDVGVYDAAAGRLPLRGLAADNELRIEADCAYTRSGEGLHRFVDPVDQKVYLHTQFETADAHRMYACFDQPDLKATFGLTVKAPGNWEVISNNAPASVDEVPGDEAAKIWRFPPTPRISTYITALVAGPYSVFRDSYESIPLGIYCRESLAEYVDAEHIFTETKQGFEFFQRVFGRPYPFGKYDQLFVPEFNAGAMENAGCVTFLERYIFRSRETATMYEARCETILHEMAHMWFGDLVTMRWWDDLWLNESFATYMSVLAMAEVTQWKNAWTSFANLEKAWAYRQDQLPSTHPIAADIKDIEDVSVNFDGITYAKGASVLKQLVAWVGLENFLSGVRTYFGDHAWGNTTLQDLLTPLEETSGRDLSAWSKEWLETAGVNTLRPSFEVGPDGRFTAFEVLQEAPAGHPTLRSHRVAIGLYSRDADGALVRRARTELDVVGARTAVPDLIGQERPDLVLVNDDDLTYTKVRLDPESLETLIAHIGDLRESLPRALCWAGAWDMTRDAEMATRDYVRLVLSGASSITDPAVLTATIQRARLAILNYAAPEWREEGLARLARALRSLLIAAEPGSDAQLIYANSLAGVACSREDVEALRGILSGTAVPEGLAVDTDLRWTLLRGLVSIGEAGEEEIAAELSRDATAAGEREAAACRAAVPTAEAKAAAWERLTGGELSGAVFRATIGGFVAPRQSALLEPYVSKYFDIVGEAWADWNPDMAQSFVSGLYPGAILKPETIMTTEEYITAQDPPPALRRLLLEGADGVRRALKAQDRDRAADQ